jgi:glycosyltransferase involved in cell wall biosynthesis
VIVYDPYVSGLIGVVLKVLFHTKLIVEVNGDYHRLEPSKRFIKRTLTKVAFYLSLRSSDAIKVLNGDQEGYFRNRFPSKPVYRFSDFVASEYFESLETYQGDYLLSVGHPFHLKGMDILIQAFKLVSRKHQGMKLRIMGFCPEEEIITYKLLAGDRSRIEFVKPGWIEDVGEQMRGCYALVNAAYTEAMGRVHLEAMACKKAVVATRTNGGMEYIEHGRTGLLCEVGNVEDLAEKLDFMVSNADAAKEMGDAGFERLRTEYSEERYTQSFIAMVEEVINGKRARRVSAN